MIYPHDFPKTHIFICLLETRDGTFWAGTRHGVFRIQDQHAEERTGDEALSKAMILCLHEDSRGALWIGTYQSGIVRLQGGRGERLDTLSTQNGILDDVAYQILDDGLGSFWISSNKGIYRVSQEEARACADGRLRRLSSVVYGKEDGMKNQECNGGSQPAGIRSEDGRLWFPTLEGLVEADPSNLPKNPYPPSVAIEEIAVDGRAFPDLEGSALPAGSHDITFQYVGLSLTIPKRVRYRYRLQGYNRGWVEAGSNQVAAYTNLGPGKYRFQVIACNEDGVWNAEGTSRSFEIRTPIWGTVWFKGLALLAGVVLVNMAYWLFRRTLDSILFWRKTHLVGPYRLLNPLGQGGVGEVHRARDRRNRRIVAVKIITPDLLDDEIRQRVQREWEICENLDHPNMVKIFGHGESAGRLYLAMELCEGPTLREVMRGRRFSIHEACALATALFTMIQGIHTLGVIHRDIKPENIIFRAAIEGPLKMEGLQSRLVLLDFGLARLVDSATRTRTGLVVGSVDYLSPEYLRGHCLVDEKLDLYAIGIIFFELLTGRTPYAGTEDEDMMQRVYAIAYTNPAPPQSLVPDIPDAVSEFALALIDKNPLTRLSDVREILLRFAALSGS